MRSNKGSNNIALQYGRNLTPPPIRGATLRNKVQVLWHAERCYVEVTTGAGGKPEIKLFDCRRANLVATATVDTFNPDLTLNDNEVYVRNRGENRGIIETLQAAGVLVPTGESYRCPEHGTVYVCQLKGLS